MNDVIFTYHQANALAAGQSGFINESGAYIFNITEAKYMNSPSGAKSIEFSVEMDDGRKANYLKTRIPFDKALGKEMETEVRLFLAELEENMAEIKAYGRVA